MRGLQALGSLPLPGGGSVTLNITDTGGFGIGTYKLITATGTSNFTNTVFSIGTGVPGFQGKFTNPGAGVPGGGTEIDLIVTAAPTWAASPTGVPNIWTCESTVTLTPSAATPSAACSATVQLDAPSNQ